MVGADADVRREDSGRSGGVIRYITAALADTQKKVSLLLVFKVKCFQEPCPSVMDRQGV